MDFFTLVLCLVIGFVGYKYFFKPNHSDKLTLMQMESWVALYMQASFFEKGSMATALIVQSVGLASVMGADITVTEFMKVKHKNNTQSVKVIENWFDVLDLIARDIETSKLAEMPARSVMAMVVLKLYNPEKYEALLSG